MNDRVIAWVSAGAASAIAGKLAQRKYGDRVVFANPEGVYITNGTYDKDATAATVRIWVVARSTA